MGCRCSDISRCGSDLSKISSGNGHLSRAQSIAGAKKQHIFVIADLTGAGIYTKNAQTLTSAIRELSQPVSAGISTAQSNFSSESSRVSSMRRSFQSEDDWYHAED